VRLYFKNNQYILPRSGGGGGGGGDTNNVCTYSKCKNDKIEKNAYQKKKKEQKELEA
jgi:hypothetical protein